MASFSRARKKRLVLDIGTSAIRLCELTQTKSGYQLTRYLQREFNSDPALDDAAKKELKVKALQELLKESKIRTKKTVFSVPGQSVFTRTRALPPVPEYKVTQIVRYEIQQQIPFSLDQIAMDYQVLDRTTAGGYEVLMAAIKVDVVDKHLEVLEACKRTVDIVDVSPLAAYNWLKHTQEFGDHGECIALIDLGATTTDIVIEREGQFRFTRPLNIGGNDITKALAAKFAMNFSDAERGKRERCAAPTGDPNRDGPTGEVIGAVLQRLVGEIMRSFAYFRSLPGGGQVNRVILCGGGACLRNIIPYLQRALGLEVRIAQPLAGLAIAPGAQSVNERPEQACIVLGLSLRCCEPAKIEINLIPPRVLEAARRKEQIFYWTLSLATLALIMASVIPVSANENKLVLKELETFKQVIAQYDVNVSTQIKPGNVQVLPPSSKETELTAEKNKVTYLQARANILDKARDSRDFWLDQLTFLNDARPKTGAGVFFYEVQTTAIPPKGGGAGAGGNKGAARPAPAPKEKNAGLADYAGMRGGASKDIVGVPFAGVSPGDTISQAAAGFGKTSKRPAAGGPGAKKEEPAMSNKAFPRSNALFVRGVAEDAATVKSFVETVRKSDRLMTDGRYLSAQQVIFTEASVQQADPSIMMELVPPTGGGRQPADTGVYNNKPVYLFNIEVEFRVTDDRPVPGEPTAQAPGAAAAAPAPAPGGAQPQGIFGAPVTPPTTPAAPQP
jgi:type IV pilus assembly protein PilM